MPRILTVVGARPQFIKAAPVSRALRAAGIAEDLIHTGQHFDRSMSDVFFEELELRAPRKNLNVNNLAHGAMTGQMLEKLEIDMLEQRPDAVLVYGDTNSTLAGALAAAKLHIPLVHIEAGLRSFNRKMPEEVNRVLTDHISDMLFCPTEAAVKNLGNEGLAKGIHLVGDVMYDVTLVATEIAREKSRILEDLTLTPKGYAVATVHRAENTDDPVQLSRLMTWIEDMAQQQPVVLPLHPRTRQKLSERNSRSRRVRFVDPLGYIDMTQLVHNSAAVFTDSGGLQKEAFFHRVPCVTLRSETEWVETIESGWNRLWTKEDYLPRQRDPQIFGDGNAAQLIANIIRDHL